MSISYTEHYNFGLQKDHSDKFLMSVLTTNFESLDTILYGKQDTLTEAQQSAVDSGITATILSEIKPTISSTTIDDTVLADFFAGTICGLLDTTITGESTTIYGVVRAYTVDTDTSIQIAEDFAGGRHYRTYTSSTWSAWA